MSRSDTGKSATAAPDASLVAGARKALLALVGLPLADESLELALTHRSYAYENGGLPTNERLEFLGDSVLGIIITDELYRSHPDLPEGQLAKLRASIVNMHALAAVGQTIGLGELLLLGRGEELTGGRTKPSIVSDAVEALLGALYLQHGLEPVRGAVLALFEDLLRAAPRLGAGLDWKTSLQELSAEAGVGAPSYEITESGPDHDKTFVAHAMISGESLGIGEGHSKKQAEQIAASEAYRVLVARADQAAAHRSEAPEGDAEAPDGDAEAAAPVAGGTASHTDASTPAPAATGLDITADGEAGASASEVPRTRA